LLPLLLYASHIRVVCLLFWGHLSVAAAASAQKPDSKGKQPATPAGEAEQHYAKQYVLLQHLRYGRRTECLQLLPLPDDCVTCGKRQHGVVADALAQLLENQCK
jgi:hypothetical protein